MAKPSFKLDLKALKVDPTQAKAIASKYGVIIASGLVLLGAPIAAYLMADGMNAALASDAAARAGKLNDLNAISSAEVTLSLPGQDPFSQSGVVINQKVLDQFRNRLDSVKQQSSITREIAVKFNQKGREPFVVMRMSADDPAIKELPIRVYDRLASEYDALLQEVGAGEAYPDETLATELIRRRSQIIDADFSAKSDAELTPEERESLAAVLADERLARVSEHARQIDLYADKQSIGAPDPTRRSTKLKPAELFVMQWEFWVAQDVLQALKSANGDLGVLRGPVKHVLSMQCTVQSPPKPKAGEGGDAEAPPPADDGSGSAEAGDAAVAAGGEPINPEAPVAAADYSRTFTGRVTNQLYDVVVCDARLVVQTSAIPQVIDALAKQNFITVTDVRVRPADAFAAAEEGYMYGAEPVSIVSLRLESIWLREWVAPFMPDDLRSMLKTSGTMFGAPAEGAGASNPESDSAAAPPGASQG